MKRKSDNRFSGATLEIPSISKTLPATFNARKFKKQPVLPSSAPPSEEMVKLLNSIGQEYPFCVYYKQKVNDPL
jgi:hypothetical protein